MAAVFANELRRTASDLLLSGQFVESAEAWDRLAEVSPALKPKLWQRGLALFYAGRYSEGAEQFELDSALNPADVEESVWRFLCMNRDTGFESARADMMAVRDGDSRVPMAEVMALFRGDEGVTTATVLERGRDSGSVKGYFYGHYYVALFLDALATSADNPPAEVVATSLAGVGEEWSEGDGGESWREICARVATTQLEIALDYKNKDYMYALAVAHYNVCCGGAGEGEGDE